MHIESAVTDLTGQFCIDISSIGKQDACCKFQKNVKLEKKLLFKNNFFTLPNTCCLLSAQLQLATNLHRWML